MTVFAVGASIDHSTLEKPNYLSKFPLSAAGRARYPVGLNQEAPP